MFKINNKDTRTMPLASTPCSSVSVVNFEHVIAGLDVLLYQKWSFYVFLIKHRNISIWLMSCFQLVLLYFWSSGKISASASVSALWHQYRRCKIFIFALRDFFGRIEHSCSFLGLNIWVSILCYKYLLLYDFLFTHPEVSVCVLGKRLFEFSKAPVH